MYYWNWVSEQSTATQSIDFLMRSFPRLATSQYWVRPTSEAKKYVLMPTLNTRHYNLQKTNSYELNMRITESVYRQIVSIHLYVHSNCQLSELLKIDCQHNPFFLFNAF